MEECEERELSRCNNGREQEEKEAVVPKREKVFL
jgi:hypothetical protein